MKKNLALICLSTFGLFAQTDEEIVILSKKGSSSSSRSCQPPPTENCTPCVPPPPKKCELPPEEDCSPCTTPAPKPHCGPCPIQVNGGYDVFVTGSFTYWQPIQENMELGVMVNNSSPLDLVNGKEIELDFDYKSGFQVGVGANLNCDRWDTFVQYTWFRGTETVSANVDNPSNPATFILPAWQLPAFLNPNYSNASESWKLEMDLVDWDFGKTHSYGKATCIRPFAGLRAAFIRQRAEINYINTLPASLLLFPSTFVVQMSHSWGIGPRFGFNSNWNFTKTFRVFGDGEIDVLYTQYDLSTKQTTNQTVANIFQIDLDDVNYLRTHLNLDLGIGWGTYFSCKKYHIDLSASYCFQAFFDQNMFRKSPSTFGTGVSCLPNGNLYISGLTANARFDF